MQMLTAKQKQFLKGLAHPLSPVVRIGKAGLTPSVINEAKRSLEAHELIKVRIDADDSAIRSAVATELAQAAAAELAATIGKLAILYRARPENPAIELPK
jgi:RNA-binding protein